MTGRECGIQSPSESLFHAIKWPLAVSAVDARCRQAAIGLGLIALPDLMMGFWGGNSLHVFTFDSINHVPSPLLCVSQFFPLICLANLLTAC